MWVMQHTNWYNKYCNRSWKRLNSVVQSCHFWHYTFLIMYYYIIAGRARSFLAWFWYNCQMACSTDGEISAHANVVALQAAKCCNQIILLEFCVVNCMIIQYLFGEEFLILLRALLLFRNLIAKSEHTSFWKIRSLNHACYLQMFPLSTLSPPTILSCKFLQQINLTKISDSTTWTPQ